MPRISPESNASSVTTISVIASWIRGGGGHRIAVHHTAHIGHVASNAGLRLGAPLNSAVRLYDLDGKAVNDISQLLGNGQETMVTAESEFSRVGGDEGSRMTPRVFEARLIVNEIVTKINLEGKELSTVSLGCDKS